MRTIATAALLLKLSDEDRLEEIFGIREKGRTFLLQNIDASPDAEQLTQVREFYKDELDLDVPTDVIESMLSLFPEARINLAVDGLSNTENNELMLNTLAVYILGCPYPINGDVVDMVDFRDLLQKYYYLAHPPEGAEVSSDEDEEDATPAPAADPLENLNYD